MNLVNFKVIQKENRDVQKIYSSENPDIVERLVGGPIRSKVIVEFDNDRFIEIHKDHREFVYQENNTVLNYDNFEEMLGSLPEDIKSTVVFNLNIFRGL